MLISVDPARSLFVRLLVRALRVLMRLLAVFLRRRRVRLRLVVLPLRVVVRRLQVVVRGRRVVRRRLVMALVGGMLARRRHVGPTFPCVAGRPLRHDLDGKCFGQDRCHRHPMVSGFLSVRDAPNSRPLIAA